MLQRELNQWRGTGGRTRKRKATYYSCDRTGDTFSTLEPESWTHHLLHWNNRLHFTAAVGSSCRFLYASIQTVQRFLNDSLELSYMGNNIYICVVRVWSEVKHSAFGYSLRHTECFSDFTDFYHCAEQFAQPAERGQPARVFGCQSYPHVPGVSDAWREFEIHLWSGSL